MLILTIANITPRHLAERLEAAHIPATVSWSLGTCAPWPIERGATAYIVGDLPTKERVESFAADVCRDLGESCALLTEVSSASLLVYATPKEG